MLLANLTIPVDWVPSIIQNRLRANMFQPDSGYDGCLKLFAAL